MRMCERCGGVYDESVGPCPNCAGRGAAASAHGAARPVLKVWLSSPLVLVLAILTTLNAIPSWLLMKLVYAGSRSDVSGGSFNLIAILIAVGLWACYAVGKSASPEVNPGGLRLISGSLRAVVILLHIAAGIVAALAIFTMVFGHYLTKSVMTKDSFAFASIFVGAEKVIPVEYYSLYARFVEFISRYNPKEIISLLAFIVGGVLLIAAGLTEILNFCFFRRANRFVRSLKESAGTNELNLSRYSRLRGWLIVLAVISLFGMILCLNDLSGQGFKGFGVTSFTGIYTLCSYLVSIAIYTVTFLWIRKYPDQLR